MKTLHGVWGQERGQYSKMKYICIFYIICVCNLFSVVGPTAKLHVTVLLVEGEPLHVDLAAGLVDGGRGPLHVPGELELSLGHQPHLVLTISAEDRLVFYRP